MNQDEYWLNICKSIASNSKCLSRKLGAVIVKDNKFIVSTGYNGPPAGCSHCNDEKYFLLLEKVMRSSLTAEMCTYKDVNGCLTCPRKMAGFASGEGLEYCQAAHAERNAISIAAKLGHSTDKCSMYLDWVIPCAECAKSVINAGIKEIIVVKLEDYDRKGIFGRHLLEQAGVKIRTYNL